MPVRKKREKKGVQISHFIGRFQATSAVKGLKSMVWLGWHECTHFLSAEVYHLCSSMIQDV